MTPAQQLALWADKLRDVSAMGGYFAENPYDKANYETIQTIAMEMMALATGETLAEMEPLRATLFRRPTPIYRGRRGGHRRRRAVSCSFAAPTTADGRCPAGPLAVGETPAEGVVREALEETGVRSEALALVGVHDSRLCGTVTATICTNFAFLCRPLDGGEAVAARPPTASRCWT